MKAMSIFHSHPLVFTPSITGAVIATVICGLGWFVPNAANAVEVVEAEPTTVREVTRQHSTRPAQGSRPAAVPAPAGSTNISAELYVELQNLRSEVMELRGLVEQQSYAIEQLEQRRMDDYLEFDRRIGELLNGGTSGAAGSQVGASGPAATTSPNPAAARPAPSVSRPAPSVSRPAVGSAAGDDGSEAYRKAYQMVKDRQFDGARVALAEFVQQYPNSSYVPNSHFWLGELYYLDSDLEKSRQSFTVLVSNYPQHRKVADAKFKLGKIYHQLGDNAKARGMLESVINDHAGSKAVNPAREYLNNSLR